MSNELVPTTDKKAFAKMINQFSGLGANHQRPMNVRFDAVNGIWSREIDEVDPETGFNKWSEMGDTIKFHLITTRKRYRADFNSQYKFYSDEFNTGDLVVIKDRAAENIVVFEGTQKQIKADPIKKEITFVEIVYAFMKPEGEDEAKLYRIHLSGSNLITYYKYLGGFKEDSVACYVTIASQGKRMKGIGGGQPSVEATEADINSYKADLAAGRKPKLNLYYEINFDEDAEYPQEVVIDRMKMVSDYLKSKVDNKEVIKVEATIDSPDLTDEAFGDMMGKLTDIGANPRVIEEATVSTTLTSAQTAEVVEDVVDKIPNKEDLF